MNRTVAYLLALVVLIGIAYGLYLFVPRLPESGESMATSTDTQSGTSMRIVDVYDSTAVYRIEAHYPQFGTPLVDEKIQAVVDRAIAEFKTYPANPPDSSVPQNEFTGSFNSTYVGSDIVSVELSISEYTGGAHPNTTLIGVNVDRATGAELTLDTALALIGKTLPQVAEQSLKELKAKLGDDVISPEGAAAKPENYGVFVVSADRVTFIFNSYQVAPYAAGHQEVWFRRVK